MKYFEVKRVSKMETVNVYSDGQDIEETEDVYDDGNIYMVYEMDSLGTVFNIETYLCCGCNECLEAMTAEIMEKHPEGEWQNNEW